jgi:hypothetical protein
MPTPWQWRGLDDRATPLDELIRVLNRKLGDLALEMGRVIAGIGAVSSFPDLATTPSVRGAKVWKVGNTGATNISALTGGSVGQEVTLWATTANTTLVNSAALRLKGGVNVTMTATETRRFATVDGLNWREI